MSDEKKSFLLYFDNYPIIRALPPDQRGWLLSALYVYADQVWRDETVAMEQVMEEFPSLSQEARVACGFIGANILRDTQRWHRQRHSKQEWKAAGGRSGNRPPKQAPSQTPEQLQREREEMARTRRLVELLKLERAPGGEAGGAEDAGEWKGQEPEGSGWES